VTGRVRPENVGDRPLQPYSKRFGDQDLGPTVSPDGKTVAFYTQRGLFEIDLYVADHAWRSSERPHRVRWVVAELEDRVPRARELWKP